MTKHIQAGVSVGNTTAIMKPDEPLTFTFPQTADAHWVVKREATLPKPRQLSRTNHAKEKLHEREWGGEAAVRTYCTAATAKILLTQLGPELGAFLAVATDADLDAVLAHLHAAVRAGRAGETPPKLRGDEPPLPFGSMARGAGLVRGPAN